jgi:hypothetical protein
MYKYCFYKDGIAPFLLSAAATDWVVNTIDDTHSTPMAEVETQT